MPLRHTLQHICQPAYVGFIQRCIHLVEYAEGAGLIKKDADEQRQGGQRLFAAREQEHVLQFLAGRLRDDVDSTVDDVLLIGKRINAWPPLNSLRRLR